jgi:hypothetical protein
MLFCIVGPEMRKPAIDRVRKTIFEENMYQLKQSISATLAARMMLGNKESAISGNFHHQLIFPVTG